MSLVPIYRGTYEKGSGASWERQVPVLLDAGHRFIMSW